MAVGVVASGGVSGVGVVLSSGLVATLDLNFAGTAALPSTVTFSRGTNATYVNSAGAIQLTTSIDSPRFDYDPITLACKGLLIEEARTNSIRNNTMQGAVVGTPGALPTNWGFSSGTGTILSQVVAVSVENGIAYSDVRFYGTNNSGATVYPTLSFETIGNIAVSSAQKWAPSIYLKFIDGTFKSFNIIINNYNSSSGYIGSSIAIGIASAPVGTLITQRLSGSITIDASTVFIVPVLAFSVINGVSIDFTIRIGLPQLELGAFATSVIPTTAAAATRNADVAVMTGTNFSSWYNQTEGTFVTQVDTYASGLNSGVLELDDNTASNALRIFIGGSVSPVFDVTTANVNQTYLTPLPSYSPNVPNKVSSAYAVNDFASTSSGGIVVTDTLGTLPSTITRALLGTGLAGVTNLNGHIARITYYPTRLPNATLQALTA